MSILRPDRTLNAKQLDIWNRLVDTLYSHRCGNRIRDLAEARGIGYEVMRTELRRARRDPKILAAVESRLKQRKEMLEACN